MYVCIIMFMALGAMEGSSLFLLPCQCGPPERDQRVSRDRLRHGDLRSLAWFRRRQFFNVNAQVQQLHFLLEKEHLLPFLTLTSSEAHAPKDDRSIVESFFSSATTSRRVGENVTSFASNLSFLAPRGWVYGLPHRVGMSGLLSHISWIIILRP